MANEKIFSPSEKKSPPKKEVGRWESEGGQPKPVENHSEKNSGQSDNAWEGIGMRESIKKDSLAERKQNGRTLNRNEQQPSR